MIETIFTNTEYYKLQSFAEKIPFDFTQSFYTGLCSVRHSSPTIITNSWFKHIPQSCPNVNGSQKLVNKSLASISPQQVPPVTNNHQRSICKFFKSDPRPSCTFKKCAYEHVCWYCYHDPYTKDKVHRAVYCPANPIAVYNLPCQKGKHSNTSWPNPIDLSIMTKQRCSQAFNFYVHRNNTYCMY